MKTLYWVTQDTRLDDNPALLRAAASDSLLIVYCVDPRWFAPRRYQLASVGSHRWNFLQESLCEFNRSLLPLGQRLLVCYERPEIQLPTLVRQHGIGRLVCARQTGWDERVVLGQLQQQLPQLQVEQTDSYTLFSEPELPFAAGDTPATYSCFRRQVEQLAVRPPLAAPAALPPPPAVTGVRLQRPAWVPVTRVGDCPFQGGEIAAWRHLQRYFADDLPLSYKDVRNALQGWDNSSKLSPWLNSGCLSPRRVRQTLLDYEQCQGRNESTGWLYVELLWREYFQWLARALGTRLFAFQGTARRRPLTCFYPDRFQMWCHGTTPYPLVNACMRELAATGYLSNRGRQIAASCLVNELQLDWRYGAAWFEQQLVDYDVAANWGNWQYIAGVGADPRGGRHFNLQKQTETFDADGSYRRRWSRPEDALPLDGRDAADWPIEPVRVQPG